MLARPTWVGRSPALPDWATFEPPRAVDQDTSGAGAVIVRRLSGWCLRAPMKSPMPDCLPQATAAPLESLPTPAQSPNLRLKPTYFRRVHAAPQYGVDHIEAEAEE